MKQKTKNTPSRRSIKAPQVKKDKSFSMKRLIVFLLVALIITLVTNVGYNMYRENQVNLPPIKSASTDLPISSLTQNGIKYNIMLPFLNPLDVYTIDHTTATVLNQQNINIYVDKSGISNVSCELVEKKSSKIIETIKINENQLIKEEIGNEFSIQFKLLEENVD